MPSWKLHRKYGELLGIDKNVQEIIDGYIDSSDHHDFYGEYIKKSEFRFTYANLITYNFNFKEFINSKHAKKIEKHGYDGITCFMLHVFLDFVERHIRAKRKICFNDLIYFLADQNEYDKFFKSVDMRDRQARTIMTPRIVCLVMNVEGDLYRKSFERVKSFVINHYTNIAVDIKREQDLKGSTWKAQRNLEKAQEIARRKNKVIFSLFVGMRGSRKYYGGGYTFPFYYRIIVKDRGVDMLIKELKRHEQYDYIRGRRSHYDIFIKNLLRNFKEFKNEELFPNLKELVEKYTPKEIINDENLLKDFLRRVFKSK